MTEAKAEIKAETRDQETPTTTATTDSGEKNQAGNNKDEEATAGHP